MAQPIEETGESTQIALQLQSRVFCQNILRVASEQLVGSIHDCYIAAPADIQLFPFFDIIMQTQIHCPDIPSIAVHLGQVCISDPVHLAELRLTPNLFYVLKLADATYSERRVADVLTQLHSEGGFRHYDPTDSHNCHDISMDLMVDLVNHGLVHFTSKNWTYCFAECNTIGYHSWLECRGVAVDFSNGLNLVLSTKTYYEIKHPKVVTRLSPIQFLDYVKNFRFPFIDDTD